MSTERARFTSLALALLLGGCIPRGPQPPSGLPGTAVEGFAFTGSPGTIVDDPANAPGGTTPAGGAEVRVFSLDRTLVATATTEPDGHFRVTDLPSGFLTVEVRTDPAAADPDGSTQVTAVADATIPLGRPYPISRDAAAATVLATAPADALVAGSMQPLPAGTDVSEFFPDVEQPVAVLSADAWFFYIDLQTTALFAHPVEYAFVDAQTGELVRAADLAWPPMINRQPHWFSELYLYTYTGMNHPRGEFGADVLATLDLDTLVAADATADASPEVVQVPADFEAPAAKPRLGDLEEALKTDIFKHNTDPASIFVIVFQGTIAEPRFSFNTLRMINFFTLLGRVPKAQVQLVFDSDGFDRKVDEYNTIIEQRLQQGLHSTFVVFLNSHGYLGESGGGRFAIYKPGAEMEVTIAENIVFFTPLNQTKACKVRFILSMCHAGAFAEDLIKVYTRFELEHDLVVYAACERDQVSQAYTVWHQTKRSIPAGSVFSQVFVQHGRIENGDITNLIGADGMWRSDLGNLWYSSRYGFKTGDKPQNPLVLTRPSDPSWCQTTTGGATGLRGAVGSYSGSDVCGDSDNAVSLIDKAGTLFLSGFEGNDDIALAVAGEDGNVASATNVVVRDVSGHELTVTQESNLLRIAFTHVSTGATCEATLTPK